MRPWRIQPRASAQPLIESPPLSRATRSRANERRTMERCATERFSEIRPSGRRDSKRSRHATAMSQTYRPARRRMQAEVREGYRGVICVWACALQRSEQQSPANLLGRLSKTANTRNERRDVSQGNAWVRRSLHRCPHEHQPLLGCEFAAGRNEHGGGTPRRRRNRHLSQRHPFRLARYAGPFYPAFIRRRPTR